MRWASQGYGLPAPSAPRQDERGALGAWLGLGLLIGLGAGVAALPWLPHPAPALPHPAAAAEAAAAPDFGRETVSDDARRLTHWVLASADHGGRPFALLDKRQARLMVFNPQGQLQAASAVLLGYAKGDDSVPGIGLKRIEDIPPAERTTPAGRFPVQPGLNASGAPVLWLDYHAALSMHKVINEDPAERRLQRLASGSASDKRISWGCINVPHAFFDQRLWPALARGGVVYVLPEHKRLEQVFSGLDQAARSTRLASRS